MYYTKDQMYFNDYSWTAYFRDDPHVTGEPDSTLLNRKEGYEVLYFINKFAQSHFFNSIYQYQKVEQAIRFSVPSDIRSQAEIWKWIDSNWSIL